MGDSFCHQCGAAKLPLAYTTYCPNDCDRLVPRRESTVQPGAVTPVVCPYCGTDEIEEFLDCEHGDLHCLPMGHVWWGQGTD